MFRALLTDLAAGCRKASSRQPTSSSARSGDAGRREPDRLSGHSWRAFAAGADGRRADCESVCSGRRRRRSHLPLLVPQVVTATAVRHGCQRSQSRWPPTRVGTSAPLRLAHPTACTAARLVSPFAKTKAELECALTPAYQCPNVIPSKRCIWERFAKHERGRQGRYLLAEDAEVAVSRAAAHWDLIMGAGEIAIGGSSHATTSLNPYCVAHRAGARHRTRESRLLRRSAYQAQWQVVDSVWRKLATSPKLNCLSRRSGEFRNTMANNARGVGAWSSSRDTPADANIAVVRRFYENCSEREPVNEAVRRGRIVTQT